jgi:hypothetical protein
MRKLFSIAAITTVVLGLSISLLAADEDLTLRGEVIDYACYRELGAAKGTGPGHVNCATDCAKKGQMLAVLTDGDGLVKITGEYTANKNSKLIEYVGKQVEVKGTPDRLGDYSAGIKVTKITLLK